MFDVLIGEGLQRGCFWGVFARHSSKTSGVLPGGLTRVSDTPTASLELAVGGTARDVRCRIGAIRCPEKDVIFYHN